MGAIPTTTRQEVVQPSRKFKSDNLGGYMLRWYDWETFPVTWVMWEAPDFRRNLMGLWTIIFKTCWTNSVVLTESKCLKFLSHTLSLSLSLSLSLFVTNDAFWPEESTSFLRLIMRLNKAFCGTDENITDNTTPAWVDPWVIPMKQY